MFAQLMSEYGTQIIYLVVTAIAGYIGIVVKNIYQRYVNDQTKKDVVKTVVQGIEQLYKDLHGEEKLDKALEAASAMLFEKGITITEFELEMLIEAAVAEFNNVFNKTDEGTDAE
jgi:hypothetical protein